MSGISSAYSFPIFVSSSIYNLTDLRAELKNYLTELGYNPYLSEGEGFHSSTPDLSPYESCLKVLSTSFITILIIDGKYGKKFSWPHWERIIGKREVSPTHGEYIFANKTKMRTLVFVREEVLNYYQVYLNVLKKEKEEGKVKELMLIVLPPHVSIETLEFIHEVKRTEPIPWLKPFTDVTDIKKELKSNMVNELAQLFLIKTQHIETVTLAFAKTLENLSPEERTKVLSNIGVTKELIEQIEFQSTKITELSASEEKLKEKVKGLESEKANGKTKTPTKVTEKTVTEYNEVAEQLHKYKVQQENLLYGTVSTIGLTDHILPYKLYTNEFERFYGNNRTLSFLNNGISAQEWSKFAPPAGVIAAQETVDKFAVPAKIIAAQQAADKFAVSAGVIAAQETIDKFAVPAAIVAAQEAVDKFAVSAGAIAAQELIDKFAVPAGVVAAQEALERMK